MEAHLLIWEFSQYTKQYINILYDGFINWLNQIMDIKRKLLVLFQIVFLLLVKIALEETLIPNSFLFH